jgi:UDP:flavonoid glycosyltransferase YjiC (YdhE family)
VKILFSSTPGEGHIRPLLPLARALRARGHEVAFATGAIWRERLDEQGFGFLAAGADVITPVGVIDPEEWARVAPADMRLFLFPRIFGMAQAPAKTTQLLEHARSWRPDAIVAETADLAAPIVAAALGVPLVNHSFGAMLPLRVAEAAAEAVAPLWREHGLEPDPYAGTYRGLYVDVAPPALANGKPPAPSVRLRLVERAAAAPPPPDGVERPFVYATMGTVYNEPQAFRMLLDALDGHPALVTTGRGGSVDGAVPKGVRVAEFVPQEEVLPHARAVVSHGGSGTMLGALAHGLPLVLAPQGADQFDNAVLCERAGVALVVLPEEASAARLRAALDRVLEKPSFAEAAERVAAEIAAMPSADEVAQRVETHAAAG